jgi:hypothetical protein
MEWEKLSAVDKQQYRDRATSQIYKGLEPAYKEHDKMVSCLARALYRVDQLAKAGPR